MADDYTTLGKAEDGFWCAVSDSTAHQVKVLDKDGNTLATDLSGYMHIYIQDGEVRAR